MSRERGLDCWSASVDLPLGLGGGAVGTQRGEPRGLLRDGRRPVGAAQSAAAQATALLGGGQRREEEQEQGSGLHRAQDCEERDPRLNKLSLFILRISGLQAPFDEFGEF